jgi:hypothetical protein
VGLLPAPPRDRQGDLTSAFLYDQQMGSSEQDRNGVEPRQRKIIQIDMDAFYASVE